jgi:serine/threonine-protein kinase
VSRTGDEIEASDDSFLRGVAGIDEALNRAPEIGRASGTRLGRFVLRAELGRGGMGIVYRADDEQLGRPVALKVLRAHTKSDPQRRARFLREARSAAALVHRNVAAVYEIGEAEGELYIAMELVAGRSLRERLAEGSGPLPLAEALGIARGVARALAAAHAKGIVHRDLKPENVMLDPEGEAKVLDFGLAKIHSTGPTPRDVLEQQPTEGLSTEEGQLLGTPSYMSPEQAQGRAVDVRSDVFSFGILLFEMLAGERPFQGDSGMDVAIAIARDPPREVAGFKRDVPLAVRALVSTCLEKAPAKRHASGRELFAALEGVAAEPAGRWRRFRMVVALVMVSAVAVTAVFALRRHAAAGTAAAAVVAVATADAGPPPVRVLTGYPPPVTNVPAAAVAYAAYMQNIRDAADGRDELGTAVRLDPTFAAAYLRGIAPWNWQERHVVQIRQGYALAQQYRSKLDEREVALLNAYEPFTHDPVDWADATERLRTVLARYPDDIETLTALAATLSHSGHREEARALELHGLELDPDYALALAGLGDTYYGVDNERAAQYYKQCLTTTARASICGERLARLDQYSGRCADYEAIARRLVAMDPQSPPMYGFLAEALAVNGAPPESVATVMDKIIALSADDPRQSGEARVDKDFILGAMVGDFPRMIASTQAEEQLRAGATDESSHVDPARTALLTLEEEGRKDEALRVADDFAKRSLAWTLDDPKVRLYRLYARHHAGLVDDATFRKTVGELAKEDEARGMAVDTRGLRFYALAYYVTANPVELEVVRPYLDEPQEGNLEALRGHALMLDGRLDEALPALRAGAAACQFDPGVMTFMHAHLWLGEALEAKGDTAGACASYAVVTERWKNAKPRSVTADEARAHARALHCG